MTSHTPLSTPSPAAVVDHLNPELWRTVNRLLVRKALSEYAHERIIEPRLDPASAARRPLHQCYSLATPDGNTVYRFEARLMALGHWAVSAESIECLAGGVSRELDALRFMTDFKQALGLKPEQLPIYLDEICSTLYSSAYKRLNTAHGSRALIHETDFQVIETSMTEGHPAFVANNGRLGFDGADYRAYAPEAASPFRIVWLAVHRDQAAFHCVPDLSYEQLLREELGDETLARFDRQLREQGLTPADYLVMPAHPWQWANKLSVAFAPYVAQQRIVFLGLSDDQYLAQQSIRTMFNLGARHKRYVKTSLSILNMGFMRGLSPYYMSGTPAINQWIKDLLDRDDELRANGFTMLREVASMGFRNHYYEAAVESDTPYKKMFSALWRENPMPLLKPGERLMTMAALLHVDRDDVALLPALIEASGLSARAWLKRYLQAYLTPLIHCFYAHDLVFMPHGENLILVLRDHVPVRVLMKDIAEEAALFNTEAQLPENVRRLVMDFPDDLKTMAVFIDIFDGFFRYMNQVLVEHGTCSESDFWHEVADNIRGYQDEHPQHRDKYARYDLFAATFRQSCLNRLQMGNNTQMINLSDPAANLKIVGTLDNPLAAFAPAASATVAKRGAASASASAPAEVAS
ncbi:MAG: IucA/IucC family siderophore biosynthesis protein [Rubrivivax sp.]|nr:MAG: IucA/IucC family siderophore biosynthesis protein [Rubrivivax sp.]